MDSDKSDALEAPRPSKRPKLAWRVAPYALKAHGWHPHQAMAQDPDGRWVLVHRAPPGQAKAWRRAHRVLSRLPHPHLAQVLDLLETPGEQPLLVEALPGMSSPLPQRWGEQAVARIGAQLASGLAALHATGWAHGQVAMRSVRLGPDGEAWLAGWAKLERLGQGGDPNRDLRALGRLLGELAQDPALGAVAALRRRLSGPNPIGAAECAIALSGVAVGLPKPVLPGGRFRPPPGWSHWLTVGPVPGWRAWTGPRGAGLKRLAEEAHHQLRRAQVRAVPLWGPHGGSGGLVARMARWALAWGQGPVPEVAHWALHPRGQDPGGARRALLALLARVPGPLAFVIEAGEGEDLWSWQVLRPGEALGTAHVVLVGEELPAGLGAWALPRWSEEALVTWAEEVNGGPLLPGQGEAMAEQAQGLPGRMAKALIRLKAQGQKVGSPRAWLALAAAARRRARAGEPLKALAAAEGALAALVAIEAPPEALTRAGTLAADLARRAGHGDRAARAYRTLLRQGHLSPGQAADLCISLARAELLEGRAELARLALDQALKRLAPLGPRRAKEARARVHLALARLLPTWDPRAACQHADWARQLSRDPALRATAKAHAAHALTYAEGARALPALEAAVLTCMQTQDPDAAHTARMLLGDALMHSGRLLDARPCFASNLARARAVGDPSEAAYAGINLALVAEAAHEPELFAHAAAGAEAGTELGDVLLEELGSELVATAQRRRGPALPSSGQGAWRTPTARAYAHLARAEALVHLGLAPQALGEAEAVLANPAGQRTWAARARQVLVEAWVLTETPQLAEALLASWGEVDAPAEAAHLAFAQALLAGPEAAPGAWQRSRGLAEQAGLRGLALRALLRELTCTLARGGSLASWEARLDEALGQAEALGDPALIAPLAAGLAAARPGPEAAKLADRAEETALQAWGLDPGPRDHPERRALLEAGGQAKVADLARRLAASEGRAASSDRVRQALASQLEASGHDLRGPLGSIRAGLQALRQGLFGPMSEEQDEALAELAAAAIGLERRVDAMLDSARLEAGALAVQRMRLDWPRVLGEPLDLLMPFAKQRGLRLKRPTEAALQALPVAFGDARRLGAALQNLLHNALKFTPAGGQVGLEVGTEGAWIQLEVWDEGPGLPMERRARPFARYGHTTGGTGLGLWLAHEVVRLHGGHLEAQSREPQGTTFRLRLPQAMRERQSLGAGSPG